MDILIFQIKIANQPTENVRGRPIKRTFALRVRLSNEGIMAAVVARATQPNQTHAHTILTMTCTSSYAYDEMASMHNWVTR